MMREASYGAAVALTATGAWAEQFACLLDDGTSVDFNIDRSQFIDAVTPEEPIRRKVTFVQMGDARFPAEPFIIGDARGFHGEGMGGSSIMFVVQPDGTATYANTTTGEKRTGSCEDR